MTESFTIRTKADFGNGEIVGEFSAFTNADDEDTVRTGYFLNNSFDEALSILTGLLEDGEPDRKGIHLDIGGGQHAVALTGEVTSGPTKTHDGEMLQWGASGDPDQLDATTATGGTAMQKAQIFQHYTRVAQTDSRRPATIEWGEYSTDGALEPLDVVFEQPKFERIGADKYRFNCTFIETTSLTRSLDGSKQTEA